MIRFGPGISSFIRVLVSAIAVSTAAFAAISPEPVILAGDVTGSPSLRAETIPVASGAELVVFFEKLRAGSPPDPARNEIPVLAVLRDTLSDDNPADDRLRQVWIFTWSAPTIAQRMAAGVPFFYHRSGLDSGSSTHAPRPILDMAQPARGTWRRVGYALFQTEFLHPLGAIPRLTTRSYGGNVREYQRTHVNEVVNIMNDHAGDATAALSPAELEDLSSRLALTRRFLGGYVRDEKLPAYFMKLNEEQTENRGHNWDLLRQAAERNGLYFEPLPLPDAPQSFGMIWIAENDAMSSGRHHFEGQFLRISDPFQDPRVSSWRGYSTVWTLDRNGARVEDGAPGGNQVRMIPLAVYSLDYPGVPLLLIDFRDPSRPQRREMALRLANDITTGVLGFTTFGNLSYFAAKSGYLFVHKRHGGATDRMSRRDAFVQLRHSLGVDDVLDPELRKELMSRVEKLDLDPVEKSWSQECRAAWRQYDALMKYAADPKGMVKLVEADRWQEYRQSRAGAAERIASAILPRTGKLDADQIAELKLVRRAQAEQRQPYGGPVVSQPAIRAEAPSTSSPARSAAAGGQ